MKRTWLNWLGLLGAVSFLSYLAAVLFSPLAYPGYDWMSQAVSDLSAADAPSRALWNQLRSLYGIGAVLCAAAACVFVRDRLNRTLRAGICAFAVMNAVSFVGYSLFPLTGSGYAGTFQDKMHVAVTALVVLLSILSLVLIITGGFRGRTCRSLALWASAALILMFVGAVGTGLAPKALFGVFERFSTLSASGFTMVLGLYLFASFAGNAKAAKEKLHPIAA